MIAAKFENRTDGLPSIGESLPLGVSPSVTTSGGRHASGGSTHSAVARGGQFVLPTSYFWLHKL
jgi:hypothetical protein